MINDMRDSAGVTVSKPGTWIQTLPRLGEIRGGKFDLVNPTPAMVDFRAMAKVLARIARFTGHTESGIYSVAQHSREGAHAILRQTGRRDAAAAFLLHDGHEAYIGDDATPKKNALVAYAEEFEPGVGNAVATAYKMMQQRLDAVVYAAAGIAYPLPVDVRQIVKEYDARMVITERNGRLAPWPADWDFTAEPVKGVDLYPWGEGTTALLFRRALQDLCGIDTFSG